MLISKQYQNKPYVILNKPYVMFDRRVVYQMNKEQAQELLNEMKKTWPELDYKLPERVIELVGE